MSESAAFRVPPQSRLAAVARLLGAPGDLGQARRFIADAPGQGVDLDLMWGLGRAADSAAGAPARPSAPRGLSIRLTPPASPQFDQVVLVVPGAGRVAMLFAGPPAARTRQAALPEPSLVRVIEAACAGVRTQFGDRIALVQALVESPQTWFRTALEGAGFISVGQLLYMRRANEPPAQEPLPLNGSWPGGVRIVTARALGDVATQNRVLVDCLDRTYEGTLDCPELCGLRDTADILDSHRACGKHDPDLWWVAMRDDRAVACALFNPYPDQRSIELVYLGLSPEVRGLGLGARLAQFALSRLAPLPMERVACAVDDRNAPARRLYDRLGFSRFDTRHAFVRRP